MKSNNIDIMLELYLQLSENQGKMYIMALQSFYSVYQFL